MTEPFLRELWERKAAHERGEERGERREQRAVRIYHIIKREAEKKPELLRSLKQVEEKILRYNIAVDKLSLGRLEEDIETIQESDRQRRLAHNALESWLNLLARQFVKFHLSNSWRDEIGLEREAVGEWACKVAKFIRKQREEIWSNLKS